MLVKGSSFSPNMEIKKVGFDPSPDDLLCDLRKHLAQGMAGITASGCVIHIYIYTQTSTVMDPSTYVT